MCLCRSALRVSVYHKLLVLVGSMRAKYRHVDYHPQLPPSIQCHADYRISCFGRRWYFLIVLDADRFNWDHIHTMGIHYLRSHVINEMSSAIRPKPHEWHSMHRFTHHNHWVMNKRRWIKPHLGCMRRHNLVSGGRQAKSVFTLYRYRSPPLARSLARSQIIQYLIQMLSWWLHTSTTSMHSHTHTHKQYI